MSESRFSTAELSRFASDGFIVVPQLAAPARVDALRRVALEQLAACIEPAEFEADLQYPGAPAGREAPGGGTVRRLLQAYARLPAFAEWARAPQVANRLRQILGASVMLSQAHHNCVMTKQPRYSSVTGWHQDIRYWSFERPELISVWLALGRETPENGCLQFLPGTHVMALARERLDDALFLRSDLPANQSLIATRVLAPLEPGDVVFFHCRTFHAAGNNRTDEPKLSLVFTYHAAANRPLAGTRSAALGSVEL